MLPPFPTSAFIKALNEAGIDASEVEITIVPCKSKKHATVAITSDVPGIQRAIVKHFTPASSAFEIREREVLLALHGAGIPAPRVVLELAGFLVLERIEGETACDSINDPGPLAGNQDAIAAGLLGRTGAWLARFHDHFEHHPRVHRRGDANLRNFIVDAGGTVHGVDFEEAGPGDPLVDLAEVIDSTLVTRPGIFDVGIDAVGWKVDACARLVEGYERERGRRVDRGRLVDLARGVMRENAARRGWLDAFEPVSARVLARVAGAIGGGA